jgi:hypothetical protein
MYGNTKVKYCKSVFHFKSSVLKRSTPLKVALRQEAVNVQIITQDALYITISWIKIYL